MSPFENKNDYSVTVFLNREKRLFTEYVHNIYNYTIWLKSQGITWDYLLVYVRRSRLPLCYYANGDFIDRKPDYQTRGRVKSNWV